MVREIALEQFPLNLQAAITDLQAHHDRLLVVRDGKPVIAMIPFEEYERWFAEREKAFKFYDELPTWDSPYSEEEVEADIEQAIREVRSEYKAK